MKIKYIISTALLSLALAGCFSRMDSTPPSDSAPTVSPSAPEMPAPTSTGPKIEPMIGEPTSPPPQ